MPILHVTHDPDEALFLGQRVAVMIDHRIRQVGTPRTVLERPVDAAVAELLGRNGTGATSTGR